MKFVCNQFKLNGKCTENASTFTEIERNKHGKINYFGIKLPQDSNFMEKHLLIAS